LLPVNPFFAASEVFRLPLRLRRLTLLLLRRETLPEVGAVPETGFPAESLLVVKALPRRDEALLSFKSVPETNGVQLLSVLCRFKFFRGCFVFLLCPF
jgi:hypothetical protein